MRQLLPFLTFVIIVSCMPEKSSDLLYQEGMKHYENKEYLHALHSFDELLAQDENYAMAYLRRSQVHMIKDDFEAASHDLNQFLEFDTLISEGYTQRAMLKFTLTDYYGALNDCNRAIEADAENSNAYRLRGSIKKHFGNYKGAVDDFSMAVNYDEKDKRSFILRGDVNMVLGMNDNACSDYHQAAELGSMSAYKRIVEHCSQVQEEVKVVTVEKIVEKEVPAPKTEPKPEPVPKPKDKWHSLADLETIIYQINELAINRDVKKGVPVEWGDMGKIDKAYLFVKLKETQVYHLQFVVNKEISHEAFYKYTGETGEEKNSVYTRVDGNWDEELISNNPLEYVVKRYRSTDRTTMEIVNYSRGVAAKVFF